MTGVPEFTAPARAGKGRSCLRRGTGMACGIFTG